MVATGTRGGAAAGTGLVGATGASMAMLTGAISIQKIL